MHSFTAVIIKIGINPLVNVPDPVLNKLFVKAKKSKGPIPVKGKLNGKKYIQTLVKYRGAWRLYLNTPMRKAAGIDEGDIAKVEIDFDPETRITPVHPELAAILIKNKKANSIFKKLAPYRQKEIARYINSLKTEEAVKRNLVKIIKHLEEDSTFAGRAL